MPRLTPKLAGRIGRWRSQHGVPGPRRRNPANFTNGFDPLRDVVYAHAQNSPQPAMI